MRFTEIYDTLVRTGRVQRGDGRIRVTSPNGTIRSAVLSIEPSVDWVDQDVIEGSQLKLVCDIKLQFLGVYKASGWELAGTLVENE